MENNSNTDSADVQNDEKKRFIEELDVVKKGFLHIKRPPTNIKLRLKTWQKRYLVLRDNTIEKGSRLEICSSKESWEDKSKKTCDKYVLDLRGSCVVSEYTNKSKSFPYAFCLTRKGHTSLILGAETEHELKQWMCAINLLTSKGPLRCHHNSTNSIFRDSINGNVSQRSDMLSGQKDKRRSLHQTGGSLDLPNTASDFPHSLDKWIIPAKGSRNGSVAANSEYSSIYKDYPARGFAVTLQRTTSRNQPNLRGELFLEVTSSYVILHQVDAETTRQVIQWPLVHIRKFKCEDKQRPVQDLLTLEASCHCECGEGTYLFQTNHGRELVLLIRDAMRKLSLKRKEQEEKLNEMRRLRMSMRTESDSCLQNKLRTRPQFRSVDNETPRKPSQEPPNGQIPYYLTLIANDYCSSTPDETSSESDCESPKDSGNGNEGVVQKRSVSTPPDFSGTPEDSPAPAVDALPPKPPPRPRHTLNKPLPPLPNTG